MSSRHSQAATVAVVLATALLTACVHNHSRQYEPRGHWANIGQSCDSTSHPWKLPASLVDSLRHPFDMPGEIGSWEDRASIARNIPGGWGGVTRRSKGLGFAIYLVDTTQRVAALDALMKAGVRYVSSETEAVPARWTYDELYDWFRYVHTHLHPLPLTGWSLDETRNRILYLVETDEAGLELDRQLTALGIPCFLVFRETRGRARLSRR